jgi:competence protein ComEC
VRFRGTAAVPLWAVAAAALLACLTRAFERDTRLVLLALAAAVVGWWWGGLRLTALDRSVLAHDVGRSGIAAVLTTAEARVGTFELRQPGRVLRFDGRTIGEPVLLELPRGRAPPQGALLRTLAVLRAPQADVHGFDERVWLRRQGVHVVLRVDAWRQVGRRGGLGGATDRLRAWLRRTSSPGLRGERRTVLEGVLLGDDAALSPSLSRAFKRSGLYHLLAVSGQNVVLLAGGMLGLAVILGLPRLWGHLAALAAIGGYVLAVGPQPSVIRAAVAGAAVSFAWLAGRDRDPWHVLLLAAVVLLAWNPYEVEDPGFQLSFGAVVAIFVGVGPLNRVLEGYPLPRWLAAVLSVSAVCSLATAPLLWLQFGKVPILGVIANALVEPVVALLLGLAFAAAAVSPVAPPLAATIAWVNGWIAEYVAVCARAVAAVPFAQVSGRSAALVAAGSLALAGVCLRRLRLR